MAKAPYQRVWRLYNDPHVDTIERWVHFKNGTVWKDINVSNPVNNITDSHYHTSRSTKPWPDGIPPLWTPQTRDHWRSIADSGSGEVTWTPGDKWPHVSHRTWRNSGGWGVVFTRFEDTFWSVADSERPDKDNLDNKIRLKLVDPWNAAVMMAEMSRTVGGVTQRLYTLAGAARALRRGRLGVARKLLGYPRKKQLSAARRRSLKREIIDPRYRQFASDWLELQYGWLPLLSDIDEMVAFAKGRPPRTFIRASSSTVIDRSRSYVTKSNIDGGLSSNVDVLQGRCKRSYIAEIKTTDAYIRHLNSVGLLSPQAVAWELVPFSFVVDWFLPVGDFLQSATATLGVEIVGTLYTERLDYLTKTVSSLVPASSADIASGQGVRSHMYHQYIRLLPEFPSAKLPSFKNPLSVTRAANALALLTQSLKR